MQPTKRNNFFTGKLLSVEEFSTEQQYHQEKQGMQQPTQNADANGVVSNLSVSSPPAASLQISPGTGLTPDGHSIPVAAEKSTEPIRNTRKEKLRKD